MIITDHFVYIHTSRSAGTFLNKLILQNVPGARMLQYHGHLQDLPEEFSDRPVIGFVRNPWDWYVSMFFDYRRKQQYVYQILSAGGAAGFEKTVARLLNLGDNSDESLRRLQQLANTAPVTINTRNPGRNHLPGLRSEHFENYPQDLGYYSWLMQLMYKSNKAHDVNIGRFEKVREDALRLFELTGTPITNQITAYLKQAGAVNPSSRPDGYAGGYSLELQQLVADKDKILIDRFGYEF